MRKNILIVFGISIWSLCFLIIGIYLAFFAFTNLEMNDRLKYEVAYLKGYTKVQKQLHAGEVEKAKEFLDFYIDAHLATLEEFSYLESSEVSDDINTILCDVISMRKTYSPQRKSTTEIIKAWHQEIDLYLISRTTDCES